MKARVASLISGVVLGVALALASGVATADQPPPIGAHRHYIAVNGAKVYVGPNFCEVNASAQGFYAFHWMVHQTDPGVVDVLSEGCP